MKYGLLGEKLSHSYSPLIHSMLGDYEYGLIEKAPDKLSEFLLNGDFCGINVTVPYKKAVMPYLADMSDKAKRIGSVNVVVRRPDGTLYGDNTDYDGFLSLVKKSKISVRGKKVLVLGSGGASLTVQTVLSDLSADSVVVISRNGENNYDNIHKHKDCHVIVNTTPVGMYPNCSDRIVDIQMFEHLEGVIDIIYNPHKTALILDAEKRGIPCIGGLYMLCEQAVRANEIFFSRTAPSGITDKIVKCLAAEMKNVVLIGMPGCGKTTIAKRLAALTGRRLVDLDREIVLRAGKTIPEIFAEDGEDVFRRLETQVADDICRESGCIISAGGGIVTRPENRDLIRRNSTVVFVYRKLSALSTKGRPLSRDKGVEALWEARSPLYNSWSDIKILNMGINDTAFAIARALHLTLRKKENK